MLEDWLEALGVRVTRYIDRLDDGYGETDDLRLHWTWDRLDVAKRDGFDRWALAQWRGPWPESLDAVRAALEATRG